MTDKPTLPEFVVGLRALEREIASLDHEVADLTKALKAAKQQRERYVDRLRESVREGKVLIPPLLEMAEMVEEDA